jgi:hypothetical protein
MSLNRLITRLAVVSALNNYLEEPWPTIAGPNIFDSKIEPVEDMKTDRAFPCCVVYTDYDKDHWLKGKKAHGKRLMTVTLELLIVQAENVDGSEDYRIDVPVTDSEIESSLDVFEVQVLRALSAGTEASDAFNYLCPGYENMISRRGASIEGGTRLAARQLTMEMEAIQDNASGVVPASLEPFLQRLAEHNDYSGRVDDIRQIMTALSMDTPNERVMKIFGYSRDVTSRLVGPVGPQVRLPSDLTFNINGAT